MNTKSAKLALNCGIWAVIGTMLALAAKLQFGFGWWVVLVAMPVCAGGAYLTESINEVITEVRNSWNKMIAWRPDWTTLLSGGKHVFSAIGFAVLLLVWLSVYCLVGDTAIKHDIKSVEVLAQIFAGATGLIFLMVLVGFFVGAQEHDRERVAEVYEILKLSAFYLAPPIALFYSAKGLVVVIVKLAGSFVRLFETACKFLKDVFIHIHSERRLICLLDTALGIFIGFIIGLYYESVFAGAIAGGVSGAVMGCLNYELVSIRWLKLVPVTEK